MLSLETLRDPDLPCDVTELTTADGARIHVRSYGPLDAPPLVLIHGFACRVEYWNAQINEFATDTGSSPMTKEVLAEAFSAPAG
ncbi:alpha/beta hydrolase [Mycobacteroides abscessus subsp. bolletii]|nr:alpha/beta hydrolase [Mycobacteroides abscessus subsp. bolletii]SKG58761.1 alpha/beta hydrolase [Mycobacteroides abscessus subsp. bolletii]